MSLTSRLLGLFSTTETSTPDSPTSSSFLLNAKSGGNDASQNAGLMKRENGAVRQDALMDEEEEPRPPYLHVCQYSHNHLARDGLE